MKVEVQFSGGKDSQASLIWAVKKYGAKNVTAVFCDTGWEHELTYKHIEYVANDLQVELKILKSKKYDGMVDLVRKKGRWPSTTARFCTEELKTKPFIDYVLDECKDILAVQGIRGAESASRSKMKIQCSVFKYYFEPYQTNSMIVEKLESLPALSMVQKQKLTKAKHRLSIGKEDPKFFTYRKNDVKEFVKKYADDIIRPHFNESDQFVIDYIIDNGQLPNPLYKMGSRRVGCYPCIMSGHQEVLEIIRRDPDRMNEIESYEIETGRSFWKVDFMPKRFQSGYDPKTGKKFPTTKDVITYLTEKNMTGDLFIEDHSISCSSYYHLCE